MSPVTAPLYALVHDPVGIFSAPGKAFGLSIPWRVATFMGLSLIAIFSIVAFLHFSGWFGAEQKSLLMKNPWVSIPLMGIVTFAFSCASGMAAHFWLTRLSTQFPHIDTAWKQGLAELQKNGIELTDHPLFLILGFPDNASASALMQASRLKLDVKPKDTETNPPILWFTAEKGDDLAIFLFLCTCCQTSLMSSGCDLEQVRNVGASSIDDTPKGTLKIPENSMDFESPQSAPPGKGPGSAPNLSTPNLFNSGITSISDFPTCSLEVIEEPSDLNQLVPGELNRAIEDRKFLNASSSIPAFGIQRLNGQEAKRARDELQHVCRLLKLFREPYCPLNGLISTVPFQMLAVAGEAQGKMLGEVTKADLAMLTTELGIRAHVIALVHGLDTDDDFPSFVRRMRDSQSAGDVDRRIGKGLSTWVEIHRETMESLAICSCDTFQRLIYRLLLSTQSLKKVDNGRLYRLMARIRGRIAGNLYGWLEGGFTTREVKSGLRANLEDMPQLAGCYFIAAQPASPPIENDERLFAHVPGVFERLYELDAETEWTQSAVSRDRIYRDTANFFFLLTLVGILTIVVGLIGLFAKNANP